MSAQTKAEACATGVKRNLTLLQGIEDAGFERSKALGVDQSAALVQAQFQSQH
jgi:hypothetical protein